MKATSIEVSEDGKTIITTETPRMFRKPIVRRFVAARVYVSDYWEWLELPNKTIVGDVLSFQLNAWKRNGIK